MPIPLGGDDRLAHTIKDVREGGYLAVEGILYSVEEMNRYAEGEGGPEKYVWYELKLRCLVSGSTRYLEWEEDDELETWIFSDKARLDEIGIDSDDLWRMDDDEEGSFVCKIDRQKYFYDESDHARFFRGSKGEPTQYYYWDFLNGAENKAVGVEKWDDGSFMAMTGYKIDPSRDISILALGVM
jgi:translation elongation factor P/translation initiation factor 5A